MTLLNKILAALAGAAAILATLFGMRAKQKAAEADAANQKADIAQADAAAGHHLAQNLTDTADRHAAEKRDSDERLAAGRRDHMENHW